MKNESKELATLDYPGGKRRAKLRIVSDRVATATQGDCLRCARVAVRNLIIDGSRRTLGRVREASTSPGLVILGGNEGQAVRECAISDPCGFTAVHAREGAKLNYPESSPWGWSLANGVSIACHNSIVRDNVLTDCTDTGVVVYCSPGTKIEENHVTTKRRSAIGGILLVDAEPFSRDYSGIMVKGNVLDASGQAMRVGIGIGPSVLSDDMETIINDGSVIGNHLTGDYMGYGIATAGLQGWTIRDNLDDARYMGQPSDRCLDDPVNPPPQAFIYNSATLKESVVQDGFFDSDFAYRECVGLIVEVDVRVPGWWDAQHLENAHSS
ncbi:hypothetical protein CspeluHIS016_0111360 [Cutaneotrichosporon spelunceum]|uniref:Right handed beta helix domain-containing protein n=1 Tax=Cutaneotrichosporon spelunceum TaxID=1672016 RepID=A0AAD3TQJ0_9TREE|nr:hypothetical protein CspeluHIS016_0111360 [Cutaneotrichosporon spelunceum]